MKFLSITLKKLLASFVAAALVLTIFPASPGGFVVLAREYLTLPTIDRNVWMVSPPEVADAIWEREITGVIPWRLILQIDMWNPIIDAIGLTFNRVEIYDSGLLQHSTSNLQETDVGMAFLNEEFWLNAGGIGLFEIRIYFDDPRQPASPPPVQQPPPPTLPLQHIDRTLLPEVDLHLWSISRAWSGAVDMTNVYATYFVEHGNPRSRFFFVFQQGTVQFHHGADMFDDDSWWSPELENAIFPLISWDHETGVSQFHPPVRIPTGSHLPMLAPQIIPFGGFKLSLVSQELDGREWGGELWRAGVVETFFVGVNSVEEFERFAALPLISMLEARPISELTWENFDYDAHMARWIIDTPQAAPVQQPPAPPPVQQPAVPIPAPIVAPPVALPGHQSPVANLQPSPWAARYVQVARTNGFLPQALQSNFHRPISRQEFATLAAALHERMTGRVITARATFGDTTDISVQKMAGLGIVQGVGGGNFNPHGQITRQEAAVILSRLMESLGFPTDVPSVTFVDTRYAGQWAIRAIGHMEHSGIMGGVGGDRFDPLGSFTREQSVATMVRIFESR